MADKSASQTLFGGGRREKRAPGRGGAAVGAGSDSCGSLAAPAGSRVSAPRWACAAASPIGGGNDL
jgi:hypothetical protein